MLRKMSRGWQFCFATLYVVNIFSKCKKSQNNSITLSKITYFWRSTVSLKSNKQNRSVQRKPFQSVELYWKKIGPESYVAGHNFIYRHFCRVTGICFVLSIQHICKNYWWKIKMTFSETFLIFLVREMSSAHSFLKKWHQGAFSKKC